MAKRESQAVRDSRPKRACQLRRGQSSGVSAPLFFSRSYVETEGRDGSLRGPPVSRPFREISPFHTTHPGRQSRRTPTTVWPKDAQQLLQVGLRFGSPTVLRRIVRRRRYESVTRSALEQHWTGQAPCGIRVEFWRWLGACWRWLVVPRRNRGRTPAGLVAPVPARFRPPVVGRGPVVAKAPPGAPIQAPATVATTPGAATRGAVRPMAAGQGCRPRRCRRRWIARSFRASWVFGKTFRRPVCCRRRTWKCTRSR